MMITLCHVAIKQADIDERGSTRVRNEAIERIDKALQAEIMDRPSKPARVIRIDMTVAEEG